MLVSVVNRILTKKIHSCLAPTKVERSPSETLLTRGSGINSGAFAFEFNRFSFEPSQCKKDTHRKIPRRATDQDCEIYQSLTAKINNCGVKKGKNQRRFL